MILVLHSVSVYDAGEVWTYAMIVRDDLVFEMGLYLQERIALAARRWKGKAIVRREKPRRAQELFAREYAVSV